MTRAHSNRGSSGCSRRFAERHARGPEVERDIKIVFCRGGREPSNAAGGVFAGCLDFVSGEIASDIFERFIGLGCAASRRPIGVCHIAIGSTIRAWSCCRNDGHDEAANTALIRLETLPCGADRFKFGAARLTERLERISRLQGRANLFERNVGREILFRDPAHDAVCLRENRVRRRKPDAVEQCIHGQHRLRFVQSMCRASMANLEHSLMKSPQSVSRFCNSMRTSSRRSWFLEFSPTSALGGNEFGAEWDVRGAAHRSAGNSEEDSENSRAWRKRSPSANLASNQLYA